MTPAQPLLLLLLMATAGCGHPTYGRQPNPTAPTDTLNGQPRSRHPADAPNQQPRGEPDAPPPPR